MSAPRRLLVITALGSAVAALTACGPSAAPQQSIDAVVQTQLRQDVHAVAAALAAHHLTSAQSALGSLNADVAAAHVAGKLDDTTFAKIRSAALTLSADLEHLTNSPTPTPTITVTTTAPSNGPGDKGDGKGKHGKGKGDQGDGGD